MDSIEYELVNFESREVYHCPSCGLYRHRVVRPGQLPAICCGAPLPLFDQYEQPIALTISEPIATALPSAPTR